MKAPRPIGVYDSGLGGLTVVRRLREIVPDRDLVYVGDTARIPYGNRSKEEITLFARQIIRFLISRGASLVVVACNTSSALALPTVVDEFDIPIIGMIQPAVKEAIRVSRTRRIGLMATEATVRSGSYRRELSRAANGAFLYDQACPKLVPLIESGRAFSQASLEAVREYAIPLKAAEVDTVILGCTHYPFLMESIRTELGPEISVIDPARSVALEARKVLGTIDCIPNRDGRKEEFFVTGDPGAFVNNARKLGWVLAAEKIELGGC